MVREIDELNLPTTTNPDYDEHSKASKAKKVVPGPLVLAADPEDATKTVDPIDVGGASTALERGKAYRVISDGSFRFRLTVGSSTAQNTDTYVPADKEVIIAMREFTHICVAAKTGNFVQAVEVK